MIKKLTLITLSIVMASLLLTTSVFAAVSKYEFSDVEINGQIVEIEAGVKENKKSVFSTCSYFSDDYGEWLGQYQADELAGGNAEDVKQFCVDNFENRSQ